MIISKREKDIIGLLYLPNVLIAKKLNISSKTVESYVANILNKLASNNRTEALLKALKNKIITLDNIFLE